MSELPNLEVVIDEETQDAGLAPVHKPNSYQIGGGGRLTDSDLDWLIESSNQPTGASDE